MQSLFIRLLFIIAFFIPASLAALDEADIHPVMQQRIYDVIGVINDTNLTTAQRNGAIEKLMDPYFDFVLMAKLSLGKSGWVNATAQQRQEYVSLFERRIKDSYLAKIDLYKDEKITLEQPTHAGKRIHLSSYIISKGEKKEVLYKFYRSKKRGWLIYDVDVLGVSIIQTYRSQFASELQKGSMEALLAKLREPLAS